MLIALNPLSRLVKNKWSNLALRLIFWVLLYYLAARIGLAFVAQPEGLAAIWLASGVALAALLVNPRREWRFFLAAIFVVNFFSNLGAGNPVLISAGFALANTLEPALGGWLMLRLCGEHVSFSRLKDVLALIGVAVLANALTASIGAMVPALGFQAKYWDVWIIWFVEDGLGILVVTPLILAFFDRAPILQPDTLARRLEAAIWIVLTGFCTNLFFGPQNIFIGMGLRPYILICLLIWAAYRFGPRVVAVGQVWIGMIALIYTISGSSTFPLGGDTFPIRLIAVQAFILIFSISSMMLAAALADRQRAASAFRESEGRLRLALKAAPGIIFCQDSDLRYTWFHNLQEKMNPVEIVGKYDADFFPPEHAARMGEIKRRALEGTPVREEVSILMGGETLAYDIVVEPLRNDAGDIVGITGVSWDITPYKRAQQALKASEEKYRSLVENINTGIFVSTLDGKLLQANSTVAQMAGYSRVEDLLSTSTLKLYADAADREQLMADLARQGFVKDVELRSVKKDGSTYWISLSAVLLENNGGSPSLLGSVIDISARKKAEETLRSALAEKEALLRELYHRTKNNMQVIQGMLVLQGENLADPAARQMLVEIGSKIQGMALVHEMLYQSKNLTQIDLKGYIQDLVTLLYPQTLAFSSRVSFVLDLESHLVPIEVAIPCGLILNELISNAFKHAFPGDSSGEVRVCIRRETDDCLLMEVSDNGVGIPPGFDFRRSESLGIQTIIALAELQLQGEVNFISPPGVSCAVRFNDEDQVHSQ